MNPNPAPPPGDDDRTLPAHPPEPAPPPRQPEGRPTIPGVVLGAELARGGMGVVYHGVQEYLDRKVAVKVLASHLDSPEFVQRFQREARILAGVSHPYMVACHGGGVTAQGQCFMVMEFIDGPTLRQHCEQNGALAEADALRLLRDVAQALQRAHDAGIIHRDVKPENVLLQRDERRGGSLPFVPKLVDLGLARRAAHDDQHTMPGTVMGTLATMAPEQFDDPDHVDFHADIYGLGCVAYYALTGRPAFRVSTLSEAVLAKAEPLGPDPRAVNPAVSAPAARLVRSMMARRAVDRPAGYAEIIDTCTTLIGSTGHTGVVPTARSAAVPRRRGVWLAAAVLLVAAGGSAIWWAKRPNGPDSPPPEAPHAVPLVPAVTPPANDGKPVETQPQETQPQETRPQETQPQDTQPQAPPPPSADEPPLAAAIDLFAGELSPKEWQQSQPSAQHGDAFALYDADIVNAHCPSGEARAVRALPSPFALAGSIVSDPAWGRERAAAAGIELRFEGRQPLCLWVEADGDATRVSLGERSGDSWPPTVLQDRRGSEPLPQTLRLAGASAIEFTVERRARRLVIVFGVDGQRREVVLPAPSGAAGLGLLVRDGMARFAGFQLRQ